VEKLIRQILSKYFSIPKCRFKISYYDIQIFHGMEKIARKNKKDDMTKI